MNIHDLAHQFIQIDNPRSIPKLLAPRARPGPSVADHRKVRGRKEKAKEAIQTNRRITQAKGKRRPQKVAVVDQDDDAIELVDEGEQVDLGQVGRVTCRCALGAPQVREF